ncbi:hypothetical protein LOTGIDRAFT_230875 [Lottia gigantea]|uniref:BRICHOS domain-containing protein n=1 Tax=Lottia gigantea TaxID=225164 RepID=V4A7M1_LOTGI|nr:hypothetical protein LOTGIDRAFT_230875 [Lottia gigantea]ESO99943.1 hypothetical protein LOTGIDRAFT_230875 [Lottia gigantea]
MSPPTYDPNIKQDTKIQIPEQDLKKPEKLEFQPSDKENENDLNAEKEAEDAKHAKKIEKQQVKIVRKQLKHERKQDKREYKLKLAQCKMLVRDRVGGVRKRCTWLVILGVAVIITAGILGIFAIKQHFTAVHKQVFKHQAIINGRAYPELVEVDYDRKLITIKNARSGIIYPADILMDYKQLVVAYRDLNTNTCYIDKLKKPFDKTLKDIAKKQKVKPIDMRRVIPSREPIEPGLVRRFAGDLIEKHCHDIPAFWIVDIKHDIIPLELAPRPDAPVPVPPVAPGPGPAPEPEI